MAGFKLKCIGGDADRISVSSTRQPSFVLARRKFRCLPAKVYEIDVERDEVTILKSRGDAELCVTAGPSDEYGNLLVYSSRNSVRVLKPNQTLVLELVDGEVITLRPEKARDPVRGHSIGQSV
jgi:hypothetical protein